MTFKRKEKGKKIKTWLIIILCLVIVLPAAGIIIIKFEGEKPKVNLNFLSTIVPANIDIYGYASDEKSGVKKLWIGLLKDGKETVLFEKEYKTRGIIPKGSVHRVPFKVGIKAKKLKISDGPAKLRIAVRDHSWRDWWKGNRTYIEKEIVFDTKPPELSILSTRHNVSQGGSGLVVYMLSEPCQKSGVYIGKDFFPGYSGYFKDKDIYLAFFALGYGDNAGTDFYVKAIDPAGNTARSGFYHHVLQKEFKTDTINISDDFLNWKLPEFQASAGWDDNLSAVDKFVFINSKLRQKNNYFILGNGKKTENRLFWEGAFGRLPNSARRAAFADHRVYKYKGNVIDKAVHMGIDLASIKHAAVPAANRGKVVFSGAAGIYGNMVCIDHGFGLFSIYAHLSRMMVNPGEMVVKGDIIGYTGTTGLAGGDHLHFGMFIDHVFVNPVEWWDATWIKNNITGKIEMVASMLN